MSRSFWFDHRVMPFVSDVENIQQLRLPHLLSFFRRRSNFPMQRQVHPAAQLPFYFLFFAKFPNQGNPSSPLFQLQRRKDKDIQQLNFFCALSPRRSEFSNTMQSLLLLLFLLLADFAFFIQTKEYTALCSLSPLPFFSCPGQLNKWHCRSVGLFEPTNNQSLGSIKEWP